MAKFSEVLTIVNGRNQKQVVCDDGKYPIYGSGGIMGYANDYICKAETVVIGRKGSINKPIFVETPFWNVDTAFGLCANSEKLNPKYLYYFCEKFDFEKLNTTVTIPSLTKSNLLNVEIPLPNLEKQKQIVELLDKVTSLIFLRKQQLAKLDELVKARFVEIFGEPMSNPMGWKRVRFDSISENLDSKRVPVTESDRKDGIYPYYGASGIVDWINDYIFDEDILLVSEDGANLLMRSTPIAFSVSGKSWVNNHAHVVRFHDFATQKFIEIYFSLIDISEYITGTAQPKLNQAKLNAMLFCWPPLALQNQFAAFVERVDQQKQTVQQSLEKLELMKKALMQEYFG